MSVNSATRSLRIGHQIELGLRSGNGKGTAHVTDKKAHSSANQQADSDVDEFGPPPDEFGAPPDAGLALTNDPATNRFYRQKEQTKHHSDTAHFMELGLGGGNGKGPFTAHGTDKKAHNSANQPELGIDEGD